MFRPAGLFKSTPCPDTHCNRSPCIFLHTPIAAPAPTPAPIQSVGAISDISGSSSLRKPPVRPTASSSTVTVAKGLSTTVPARSNNTPGPSTRPLASLSTSKSGHSTAPTSSSAARTPHTVIKRPVETPSQASTPPPPAKVPKIGPGPVPSRAAPPSVTSLSPTGAPILNINAANTNVPLKDRQRMATVIYETFKTLYSTIPPGPHTSTLAGQHAIAQEAEVYAKSQKTTYKNNGAHTITLIKKRPKPDSVSHPSVGTQGTIEARKAEAEKAKHAILKREQLESARLSRDQLSKWGYLVTVPSGPGGTRVSDEGREVNCERCQTLFVVRAPETPEAAKLLSQQCTYHWGRTYINRTGGVREMVHKCCGSPAGVPGCVIGAHVFKDPDDFELLHARHPYSMSSEFGDQMTGLLDIAALDCEMIYTTAGMSVARVSVVDGAGKCVYDKLIKPDAGVEVLDYNTRFSGVKSLESAEIDLDGVRREMRKFIGPETILIGHALENDMRALRMVHLNVVDTAVLFPHNSGFPYRRALKDLAREYLGQLIQNNVGAEIQGHSSLEDAVATLDLVKVWVRDRKARPLPR